jgi:hypothetical protein
MNMFNLLPDDVSGETADNCFYFGEFGHGEYNWGVHINNA